MWECIAYADGARDVKYDVTNEYAYALRSRKINLDCRNSEDHQNTGILGRRMESPIVFVMAFRASLSFENLLLFLPP